LHTAFASQVAEDTESWALVESPLAPSVIDAPVVIPIKYPTRAGH
jgi:hypothetical protein